MLNLLCNIILSLDGDTLHVSRVLVCGGDEVT